MQIKIFISFVVCGITVLFFACQKQDSEVAAQSSNLEKNEQLITNQIQNNNQAIKKESSSQLSRPAIVSRQDWNAKKTQGTAKEHSIRFITIHHTASALNQNLSIEKKLQSLQAFSQSESRLASGKMKLAWFDVPYHYYIAVDGKIAEGREIKFVGDTNTDYDPTEHALVVLEGNFETEQPSVEQQKSLQILVAWLSAHYKVQTSEIKAHNDYTSTACPGKNLKKLLPMLREKVSEIVKESEKN
jgi:hypothetical protein